MPACYCNGQMNRIVSAISLFDKGARGLGIFGMWMACAILVFMVGHVLVEIVLRSAFSKSTYVLDEFVGYGIAATTFLSLAYALRRGVMIRVNLLLGALALGGRGRQIIEIACGILTACACGVVVRYFWISVARHFERGTASETIAAVPMWIPEGLVLAGLIILEIELIAFIFRVAMGMASFEEDSRAKPMSTE